MSFISLFVYLLNLPCILVVLPYFIRFRAFNLVAFLKLFSLILNYLAIFIKTFLSFLLWEWFQLCYFTLSTNHNDNKHLLIT